MFLKNLEILGFKSFADRTRIEFADGISALLGPNGCGKSNVVDAIKWVLGEQASKSLRAEAMEDVIFNGTETRKALNVAEVTLTLGNEDGILPLDMSEITIRRRLFRNGDSEYYINNAPVKLRELRELFYDTGVGKTAYSIMEQGKIDQILSNRPEERRNLFEEAAGITRFKVRGLEAERKLEKTDENIRQIESILSEVKRSYDSLKKQADKTHSYRGLKDQAFELDLNIQLLKLKETKESSQKQSKELENHQRERDELKKNIDNTNETLESSLDEMNAMEAQLIGNQKKLYGIELEKNNHDNQIKMLAERIREIEEKIVQDVQRSRAAQEKALAVQNQLAQHGKSISELGEQLKKTDEHIQQFASNVEAAQSRIKTNSDESTALEESIKANDLRMSSIQADLTALTDRIVSQLDRGLGDSDYDAGSRQEIENKVFALLDSLTINLTGRRDILADLQKIDSEDSLRQGIAKVCEGFPETLKLLDELRLGMQDFSTSMPLFLDEFLAPEGTITKKRDLDSLLEKTHQEIIAARKKISDLGRENTGLSLKIGEYRDTLEQLRLGKERSIGQKKSLEEQVKRDQASLAELRSQIGELEAQSAEDRGRINGIKEKIEEVKQHLSDLSVKEKELQKQLDELEKGISTRSKTLLNKEKQLKSQMLSLAAFQDKVEKSQITGAELASEIRNICANFREKYSRDLLEFESRQLEQLAEARELREQASDIKEQLRALGSVNLMAVEEFAEVKERYDFLSGQLEDLRKAKDDLVKVTDEIRQESAHLFSETYEKIRRHFHVLFRRLFGGGRAEIKLTSPEAVLQSGIEIYAQPPGKKLENIALLSGGERSLTAVALLFATYIVKPSPFCLLDEIDAALDESNVNRFVSMLMEFGETSQFIIITHNKKTVTGAKTLLGVTMEESGVSKIIAIRLSHDASSREIVENNG